MHCCDATASSYVAKVRGEVFARFHAPTKKVTVVCKIDCLACQDKFFVSNLLDVKENDERGLDFALHQSSLFFFFGLSEFGLFHWELILSSLSSCQLISRVSVSQNLMDPSQNRMRPDTRLKIKGRKNRHIHQSA
jgi:hypothetical protein